MSNLLKVAMIDLIRSLHRQGLSQRRIASELGINRETVARYLRRPSRMRQNQPLRPPARLLPTSSPIQPLRPPTLLHLSEGRAVRATAVGAASASPGAMSFLPSAISVSARSASTRIW